MCYIEIAPWFFNYMVKRKPYFHGNMYSLNSYCLILNFIYYLLEHIWKALNGPGLFFLSGVKFSHKRAKRVLFDHVIKKPWIAPRSTYCVSRK